MLDEVEVWDIVETMAIPTDATQLTTYKRKCAKAKRLILDGVKDHTIPHMRGNDHAFEVWETLTDLCQSYIENRKMALRDKTKAIKMKGSKSVVTYLSRFIDVRDEIADIGETVAEIELVHITLHGFPKSWEVFVEGIVARENLPDWNRLWSDCVQNEIHRSHSGTGKHEEEENVALTTKGRKGKSKQGASSSDKKGKGRQEKKESKEKDISKVKCWVCQKMRHYAVTCPEKKNKGKGKNVAAFTEIDEFASQFDREFSFIASLATSVAPSSRILYVDNGASRHMTGATDQFTQFSEKRINLEVELGDERIVKVIGVGTISFQREFLPPLAVSEVLYVLGLEKNLILVSTIEDRGYEVTFRGGQVIMYSRGSSIESSKLIGVWHKKLYRFDF